MAELFFTIFDSLRQMTFEFMGLNISLFDLMICFLVGFMLIKFLNRLSD